jgi:hypothetical protein
LASTGIRASPDAAEAEAEAVRDVDLHDQRLDQDLGPLDVELVDHVAEGVEALLARLDHEGVGRRVGGDRHALGQLGDGGPQRLDVRRSPGLPSGGARLPADQAIQGVGELLGVGVTQVVHVDAPTAAHRHVELLDHVAQLLEALSGSQDDQRVGALIGDDPHPARARGA